MLLIYHGSEKIVEKPIYGYGKSTNDYGIGFYCTEDSNLAKEWSVDKDRDGYVNSYRLDMDNLKVMRLSEKPYGILNWISILIANRTFQLDSPIGNEAKQYLLEHFLPDYEDYDVIIGYRADDSYFSFARDFLSNTISLEQLSEAMYYGNLGEQIVLKSKKAFDAIEYVGNEYVKSEEWFPAKENRDTTARRKYFNMDRGFHRGETYVLKILEEELTNDQLRI